MMQEDKELLLKDLCTRLPYGVKCCIYNFGENTIRIKEDRLWSVQGDNILTLKSCVEKGEAYMYHQIKPYLFPLSSISEEQRSYINGRWGVNENFDFEIDPNWGKYFVDLGDAVGFINWCYENHFDINGLIPRGLAEDATDKNIY
jgi:hypothetical protein